MEVFIVFESFNYSEEDYSSDVKRIFSSRSDADSFCSFMNDSNDDPNLGYFVVSYKVY